MSIQAKRASRAITRGQLPSVSALAAGVMAAASLSIALPTPVSAATDTAALERRIAELESQLTQARAELNQAQEQVTTAKAELKAAGSPQAKKITLGPVKIGGAIRANYVYGDYPTNANGAPSRGGDGGNFALDTFRINADLNTENVVGKLEYRWYNGYNFIHTGWLGHDFDDGSQLQIGVNRAPFGSGPYSVSQSWFFDQSFYVGLTDDPELGIKYVTSIDNWALDFAYYPSSEWNGMGGSLDSARYAYDVVKVRDGDGNATGFVERNQLNVRAIYTLDGPVTTKIGASAQYGQLKGEGGLGDGHMWAGAVHMTNNWDNWLLASQISRYKYDVDSNYKDGKLVPMGAYDYAADVAADAWVPAVSLSYLYETNQIPWLDSVRPYIEYSNIIKQESSFNDSDLITLGAAWARQGWYIYTDLAWSNGNYFVGNKGDFGANVNNERQYRFNINFGYYF